MMYQSIRDRPGIPWDAPRPWFRTDEAHEAWHARQPLLHPDGERRMKVSRQMRDETYRRDGWRCLFCRATERLTIDHIVPRAFGGSNHPNNRRTLCTACNGAHFVRFHQQLAADARRAEAA